MADQSPTPAAAIAAAASGSVSITAAGAAACCLGPATAPLVVAAFGASGAAWLAGLKPYEPYLLAGSLVVLLYASWTIRRERRLCAAQPGSRLHRIAARFTLTLLCLSGVLWVGAVVAFLLSSFSA